MASKTTSAETTNSPIDGTEEIRIAKSGSNFKNTFTQIKTWLESVLSFLKTDGSSIGATGQAQEFTNGVSSADTDFVMQLSKTGLIFSDIPDGVDLYAGPENGFKIDRGGGVMVQIHPLNLEIVTSNGSKFGSISPDGKINRVKCWRAQLTQGAINPPTAEVLENTIGEDLTFSYDAVGHYSILSASDLFTDEIKTFILINHPTETGLIRFATAAWVDEGTIGVNTFSMNISDGTPSYSDDFLNSLEIQILVFP